MDRHKRAGYDGGVRQISEYTLWLNRYEALENDKKRRVCLRVLCILIGHKIPITIREGKIGGSYYFCLRCNKELSAEPLR